MKPAYCSRESGPSPSELAHQAANKHLHFLLRAAYSGQACIFQGKIVYINVVRYGVDDGPEIYLRGNPDAIRPEFIEVAPKLE